MPHAQPAVDPQLPQALRARVPEWCQVWALPELPSEVDLRLSGRFRSSLGRCYPSRGVVRIARFLLDGPTALLEETLCHELAHVAAHHRHGSRVRAHGPEWRQLMCEAGFVPRARIPEAELNGIPRPPPRRRVRFQHHCPPAWGGCGAERVAGRAMRAWRCRRCYEAGRHGKLEIYRLAPGDARR